MPNISASLDTTKGPGIAYTWTPITENDTVVAQLVEPGTYLLSVEGTFGGGSIEIKAAVLNTAHKSIPHPDGSATVTFDAATDTMIEITFGKCYVLPVRAGGSSMSLSVFLYPITRERVR